VKDLNLRPDGKESFVDFIARKQPKSNEDKFPVVVFWLHEILGISPVNINHIGTIFRMTDGWREPADLPTAISVTASRKATLNVSDTQDIKLTPQGRNFVEYDLPPKSKPKK
jgi:hypothetical protein